MKNLLIAATLFTATIVTAQIKTPAPSPAAKTMQTVGLTDVTVEYSRPAKKGRTIFGDLVPFDKMWRTGANKNTVITTSDILIFDKDTLQAGTYAIFATPMKEAWEIIFYTNTENWGAPEKLDDKKVALTTKAMVSTTAEVTESFTISIDNVSANGAHLVFSWDKTKAKVPFAVATKTTVMANIEKTMAGPTAADYYAAGDYYYSQKKDLKQALEWVSKGIDMRGGSPFWMLRKKSLIQAELGDYKGAIETAKLSLEGAKKANYDNYIKMNEASIKEWSAKK